jgi:hypothetical protein
VHAHSSCLALFRVPFSLPERLVRGWPILFGELLSRDFVEHGAPLTFYVPLTTSFRQEQ